jgi:exoribonuclease-2
MPGFGKRNPGVTPMMKINSLLLYKKHAARLVRMDDRLEIELQNGETARVRAKDVTVLHPGPIATLADLRPVPGEVQAAWEILAGAQTTLQELTELIYGKFIPATAWAAWQQVMEGEYFEGTPDAIRARTAEEVTRRKMERDAAEASQRAYREFLDRVRSRSVIPADRDFLRDVEDLAYGRKDHSTVLRALGRADTPENAHALLLDLNVWTEQVDPYPQRMGITWKQSDLAVPDLPEEDRRDLMHLAAYAIDDEDTDTPDDAFSLEETSQGKRLWVHIADVAALVPPDSPIDLEARARAESLHLPEGTIHLLPREVTQKLGLGLNEISPALSFAVDLNALGEVTGFEVFPSQVRVTRLSYTAAEGLMDIAPFVDVERLANALRNRRKMAGAVMIDFPEVNIGVENGSVDIRPLPPLRSRALVEEIMILTGVEAARYAFARGLRLAFSQQEPLESAHRPSTLAEMFAFRRQLKRSRFSASPAVHGGLGAPAYTQVTSPLRRYLDLVGHQQLRASLRGAPLLEEEDIVERIGAVEAVLGSLRQAEVLSERHWSMVYLLQHPDWRGEGILVEKRGASGTLLIPSLALETRVHLGRDIPLDEHVQLMLTGVDLPQRDARFRLIDEKG